MLLSGFILQNVFLLHMYNSSACAVWNSRVCETIPLLLCRSPARCSVSVVKGVTDVRP
jgi:hypothetical protein